MKNKHIAKRFGILFLAFGLSFASAAAPSESMINSSRITVSAAAQKSESLTFKMEKYERTYKTKAGVIYKTISYEYPVAQGDSTAAQAINKYFKTRRASWIKYAKYNLEEAKEMAALYADMTRYYFDEVTCQVTNNDGTYICIRQQGYEYTMGAHGMPYWDSVIFDAATGERVTPAKILGISKKALNAKVSKLYLRKYDKTVGTEDCPFFVDEPIGGRAQIKEVLSGVNFNSNRCYLKNGKLRFYVEPYLLGPYASGFIEVSISLK